MTYKAISICLFVLLTVVVVNYSSCINYKLANKESVIDTSDSALPSTGLIPSSADKLQAVPFAPSPSNAPTIGLVEN